MRAISVARSTIRGLRIAHLSRTDNAEASRRSIYTDLANTLALAVRDNTTTKTSTVVSFLTVIESCEVSNRQERASDKRC